MPSRSTSSIKSAMRRVFLRMDNNLLAPVPGFELVEVVVQNFRRGHDDAERGAEFVRDHRDEVALELAEFFFAREGFEQFRLGLFALEMSLTAAWMICLPPHWTRVRMTSTGMSSPVLRRATHSNRTCPRVRHSWMYFCASVGGVVCPLGCVGRRGGAGMQADQLAGES
jgi:hypothetical protein